MQIVTRAFFNKENNIQLPLAMDVPTAGTPSPSNGSYIDNLCISIEKSLLLNALGLALYNEFQLALSDIDNVANAKWKLLLNGEDYDGKVWNGLNKDLSFIAQKVYETYVTDENSKLTQSGNVQINSENASLFTPVYKIANANQLFTKMYQGSITENPIVYRDFIDYFGDSEDVEISLYQYLIDRKTSFPTWEASKFKFYYEEKNSFGL